LKKLFLIPVPIVDDNADTIPLDTTKVLDTIDLIIAERGKTVRKFIKMMTNTRPISDFEIIEIDEVIQNGIVDYEMLSEYDNVAIMSESGCPCVADPGHLIVLKAHQNNIEIIPLVGPSSIILALMASGFNGQNFVFNGYLSAKKDILDKDLLQLEFKVNKANQTQIFIETPYRNIQMMELITRTLSAHTLVCVASNITSTTQRIITQSVGDWKKTDMDYLKDAIAIFLIGK
jgi:16S rRNA (cytidine1402-2'-O)-methyltransferase